MGAGRHHILPRQEAAQRRTGAWDRDITADIKAISNWDAVLAISLIEDHEITSLEAITWIGCTCRSLTCRCPGLEFERAWAVHGESVRARVRDGFNIVAHCKGGLGRAGTIASRLMIELGVNPHDAVEQIRAVRPWRKRNMSQLSYAF